ncbi:doublecortin domain-containing protein 2-like isoform X2 [Scyliorhinus canicula]|uniref:doublecortin domain-containing protein 2-like isoform X2 n=1 Tax=Scyliorhinus canicula TaxID=7830 RepID=UPI0018F429A8|nr:doublecortin domain-containing protein 2-like isoform X2 [Scyliorhinus canicula]
MATTKPTFLAQPTVKCVRVYRNGDPFYAGRKFVINERQISTFEAFLKEVTNGLEAPFGAVRNIYTPQQGHRVYELQELDTGKQYVAGGKERFKKLDYFQIGIKKKKPLPKDVQVKPVAHSRIIASARFRKPTQEPCIICVFTNGDLLNPATRLLIPKRILGQWEQVLSSITEKVNLRTGAVRKLHTLDGKFVNDGTELENGGYYVAVGRDKFKKLPYGELVFSKVYPRRSNGSKAASLPPIPGSKKSKEHGERQVRSTGTTSEVYLLTSPQPPKRKEKKEQVATAEESVFRAKAVKVRHVKNSIGSPKILRENDCVFKAFEERTETMDAVEIQEDNQTQVELPIDQRPAETVDEEEDPPELCEEESSHGGVGNSPNVERKLRNGVFNDEEIFTSCDVEEDVHQHDLPHKEPKTSEESETDHQIEEEIAEPEEEVQDIDQTEEKQEDKYFHQKEETMGEENGIDHRVEDISDPAEEVEDIDQTAENQEDKSFHQNDLPHKEEIMDEENGTDHQEEEISDPEEEVEETDQMEEKQEDKYFQQNDLPHKEELLGEETGIHNQIKEDIADPAKEGEQDIDQMEENHEDKNFQRQEDEFQKDVHQALEDSSGEGEKRHKEIDKENEVIPTEEHSQDIDNLGEILTSPAESIPSPLETDGKETIQSTTGHAVLAQ